MLPGKPITPAVVLQMLRRRAWLIAIPPAITFFCALLYSSTVPNLYQSDMLIAVDPQSVPDSFVRSTVTLRTDRRLEALKVRVLSRTTLEELIKQFDLYPEERKTMPMEAVVGKMRLALEMPMTIPRPRWGEEPQPTAFRLQFTHTDPKLAARVTQRLGALFLDTNVRERGALAGATNRFLESQLAESRAQLEAREQRLEEFRQRHGRELPTQMQSNLQALTTAQLRVQGIVESIARDRDRKLLLERLYREAAAERPAPVVTAGVQPPDGGTGRGTAPASFEQQLATARANLANLELRYTPDHPDVVRMKRLIVELEPKAAAETRAAATQTPTNDPATISAQLDPARRESLRQMLAEIESLDRQVAFKEAEETRVRGEISEYQRRVEAVPGVESEWVSLTRDYETQQTAYKDLLTKSAAAQLAANLEDQDIGERFRIVDPAVVPVRPLPSLRIRYNLMGIGIGLVIAVGIALLLELKDKSFRSESDVLDVLGLPVMLTVWRMETKSERTKRARRRLAAALAGATCVLAVSYVAWVLKLWESLI